MKTDADAAGPGGDLWHGAGSARTSTEPGAVLREPRQSHVAVTERAP
jgi:hypothetical protein